MSSQFTKRLNCAVGQFVCLLSHYVLLSRSDQFVSLGLFVLFCWVIRFVGSVRFVRSVCFCFGGSVRFVGSVRLVGSVHAISVRHVEGCVKNLYVSSLPISRSLGYWRTCDLRIW